MDYGFSNNTISVYYNTVFIGGTATGTATWAYQRSTSTPTTATVRNNIFFNSRTGGSVNHFAMGDASHGSGTFTVSNNLYVGTGSTAENFMDQGTSSTGTPVSFSAWISGKSDVTSYGLQASAVTASNLFTDIANGNLNIIATNQEAWLVAGKASQLAIAGVTDIDYNGNARSTTAPGGKTSIGSHEFSLAGLPAAPDATISGAPDTGTPTTITVNGRTIASITWYGSGLPSGITVKYYSGRTHPNATTGFNSNGYWVITQTGGTSFTYDLTLYYEDADLGSITESRIKVAKYDSGNWLTYAGTLNTKTTRS